MNKTDTQFLLGYIEQGIGGGQDPLTPPVSISRNGTLAKWRGKMNVLDVRVNDPGLRNYAGQFTAMLEKTEALGIKTVLTLPEYVSQTYALPPEPPAKKEEPAAPPRKTSVRPENLVHFRPCYLALPSAVQGNEVFATLSAEDCLPIIELAARFKVENVIVPVSEPGTFLDPQAETHFKKSLKIISDAARPHQIKLHLRNGGISNAVFKKMAREFGCGLAFNVGIAYLEGEEIIDTYRLFRNDISILMLQQILPGLDKWAARRDAMEKALKEYLAAAKDHKTGVDEKDGHYAEQVLKRWNIALHDYYDASRNQFFNLGLFQNGDLNLVPLLRELKKDVEAGSLKHCLIEAVPNTRNTDFVLRNVMPDNFPGSM
ncbi:MAG: hypothetical protein PHD82_15620 [Candidatus Riflebacteria bacterium]|nr:hypothetical protein [Candidatus Riflebacteria bacterium]